MRRSPRLLCALAAACAAGACAAPDPLSVSATYSNPVIDQDFPDPAVIDGGDGYHYVYATQGGAKPDNIQAARSRDLVTWERLGDALPVKPAWASRTQDFWAPHAIAADGIYYLYYSAKPDSALEDPSRGLCLAVATASRPEGPFTDSGRPLQCGPGFVDIDPMAYDDPATGKSLLYWGSGFGPIKVRELAADRISFAPGSAPLDLVHPVRSEDPSEYRRLIEGAWITRRGDYYYLFYSGDNCCGPKAHYATLVARSRSATGPFETPPGGGVILAARGRWVAPGHNAIAEDGRRDHWILYHAVDAARPRSKPSDEINTRRVMLLDRIVWRGGWPALKEGGPSSRPQPAPRVQRQSGEPR